MRSSLQRQPWFVALVAACLLFATSGASIHRMQCLGNGHLTVAFGQLEDCCADDAHGETTVAPYCCEFGSAQSPVDDLRQGGSEAPVLLSALPVFHGPSLDLVALHCAVEWLDTRPPPDSSPRRLARNCTWLI